MCGVCAGWTPEELLQEHLVQIERYGWSPVIGEGSPTGPPFGYTVGLTRQDGHPELLVSGLPLAMARGFLRVMVDRVVAGEVLEAGTEVDVGGGPVRILSVQQAHRLVVAQRIYGEPSRTRLVPALQLVWPDTLGRWPWEMLPWREAGRGQELFDTSPWT